VVVNNDIGQITSLEGKPHTLIIAPGDELYPANPVLRVHPAEKEDFLPLGLPDLVTHRRNDIISEQSFQGASVR